jgi:S1-C subfamily serine protease
MIQGYSRDVSFQRLIHSIYSAIMHSISGTVGDIIQEIGGKKLSNMKELLIALSSEGIGREVQVKHSRNGEMLVSSILLAETPEENLQIQR